VPRCLDSVVRARERVLAIVMIHTAVVAVIRGQTMAYCGHIDCVNWQVMLLDFDCTSKPLGPCGSTAMQWIGIQVVL